jgi:hypothetical protein
MHAWGLRLRRVLRVLAMAHPSMLPSAMLNGVGTPVAIISQLNTLPACAPVNASMAASRLATHDSGPGWIATPFLYDSFIHNSTPVYPGALSTLLVGLVSCYEWRNISFRVQRGDAFVPLCGLFINMSER